jgi:hypothetical protein
MDHSPVQVAEAAATATQAGLANARFIEADVGTLTDSDMDRLPPLDVVMLHGVWTWVSDAVRQGILRLLSRRLAPGALVYVGYNALPAAAGDFALQALLRQWAGQATGAGGSVAAAEQAMAQLRQQADRLRLRSRLPQTPMLQRLLSDPPTLEPAFVAHEFLTAHWRPVFHGDLCEALSVAKLSFVGSSNLFEALPSLYMEPATLKGASALPGPSGAELLKDLCLPRSFRADVFMRGPRRIDRLRALDAQVLAACRPWPAQSPVLHTGVSQACLPDDLWRALGSALQSGPLPLGELRKRAGAATRPPGELLALLVGTGHVVPVFRAQAQDPARRAASMAAARFNTVAAARYAEGGQAPGHFALASPASAGGVAADALDLALVAALGSLPSGADSRSLARFLCPDADATARDALAARIDARGPAMQTIWSALGIA